MMEKGQSFTHQSVAVIFKGLQIPGCVSRIPLLHQNTLCIHAVASNISVGHSIV